MIITARKRLFFVKNYILFGHGVNELQKVKMKVS